MINHALRHYEKAKKEALLERCRNNFKDFYEYVLQDASGDAISLEPFNEQWCDFLEEHIKTHHVAIISPPGFGKTIFGQAYNMYRIGNNPNIRTAWISVKEETAIDRTKYLRQNIEKNERLQEVFPDLKPGSGWTDRRLTVLRDSFSNDPTIMAQGMDAAAPGKRYDLMFLDDHIGPADMESEAVRNAHRNRFKMIWEPRLVGDGSGRMIMLIMYRWHDEDAVSMVMRDPSWKVLIQGVTGDCERLETPPEHMLGSKLFPSVDTSLQGEVPIPSWKSATLLRDLKASDPITFGHQYEQRTLGSYKKTFSQDSLQMTLDFGDMGSTSLDNRNQMAMASTWGHLAISQNWPIFITSDFSGKRRKGSVALAGTRDPRNGRKVIIDCAVGDWGAGPEFCQVMIAMYSKWGARAIYIEDAALQGVFVDWANKMFDGRYPFCAKSGSHSKWDQEMGIPSLAVSMMKGEWLIPVRQILKQELNGSLDRENPWCRLVYELRNHPTSSDDCIMALWMMFRVFNDHQLGGVMSQGFNATPQPTRQFAGGGQRVFAGGVHNVYANQAVQPPAWDLRPGKTGYFE